MRLAEIQNVAELKQKIEEFEESILIVTYKGKFLNDNE
jgi:hypothetical protein